MFVEMVGDRILKAWSDKPAGWNGVQFFAGHAWNVMVSQMSVWLLQVLFHSLLLQTTLYYSLSSTLPLNKLLAET